MVVVFDAETVRAYKELEDAPDTFIEAWENAHERRYSDKGTAYETFKQFAGLHPEFCKIVCVSLKDSVGRAMISFSGKAVQKNEQKLESMEWLLLKHLSDYLRENCKGKVVFVGHNIKAFDIPLLQTRWMANGMSIPALFKTFGIKPWDLSDRFHDTLEIWRGGAFRTSQIGSLDACCNAMGIPTPKDGISGADVGRVYWDEDGLDRIIEYCEKDVEANGQLYKKLIQLGAV